MRYYKITLTPSAQTVTAFAPITYSTLNADGSNNTAALRVDMDIYQTMFHQPAQNGLITIYGVPFADLNQSANFNLANVSIEVGMSQGLPFANPNQKGLIISGTILQAYGNFQGTDVRLNLIVTANPPSSSAYIPFIWTGSLEAAIRNTLINVFNTTDDNIQGSLSPNLVTTEIQPAMFFSLTEMAKYVYEISKTFNLGPKYIGARITESNGVFYLFDGTDTVPPNTTNIQFTDIIGNLTWLDIGTIQAKLVMRNDIDVGSYITLPVSAPTTNVALKFGAGRGNINFSGVFLVTQVRHVGSSRQASADSWCTIVDAIIK